MLKAGLFFLIGLLSLGTASAQVYQYNDVHVNVTGFRGARMPLTQLLKDMDKNHVGRAAIFGICFEAFWHHPTQQWRYRYARGVDTYIAQSYLALAKKDQQRFVPLLMNFDPANEQSVTYIQHMLAKYPGVFRGLGEFAVAKDMIYQHFEGKKPQITSPALDKILAFATKKHLVVLLHADIDTMAGAKNRQAMPANFAALKALFMRFPKLTIIWAHTGLGQYIIAKPNHLQLLAALFAACPHLKVDISWDVVIEQIGKNKQTRQAWVNLIKRYPTRFLFGTDAIVPTSEGYAKEINRYNTLWRLLPPAVAHAVKVGNFDAVFGAAAT